MVRQFDYLHAGDELPLYCVCARNTATASENKIHDDSVARQYGFSGGLVPGVVVYAYMTVPLVATLGLDWLERGGIKVRFQQPVYDGEETIVRAKVTEASAPLEIAVSAERADGTICATGTATLPDLNSYRQPPVIEDYPLHPLPEDSQRPPASREILVPGSLLGSIDATSELQLAAETLLKEIDERLPIYYGPDRTAHPASMLSLANQILMRNVRLGPWIHTASEVNNWSVARCGEMLSLRGHVADCFERKGHEFVVLDLLLVADQTRPVQHIKHTAIYRPRSNLNPLLTTPIIKASLDKV